MKPVKMIICKECQNYICICCKTKSGWKHQKWCSLSEKEMLTCDDCYYCDTKTMECKRPIQKAERKLIK